MNIHQNARLTPLGRERLVNLMLSGQSPEAAARAAGFVRAPRGNGSRIADLEPAEPVLR